jgi:hypothetical protein
VDFLIEIAQRNGLLPERLLAEQIIWNSQQRRILQSFPEASDSAGGLFSGAKTIKQGY